MADRVEPSLKVMKVDSATLVRFLCLAITLMFFVVVPYQRHSRRKNVVMKGSKAHTEILGPAGLQI